MRAILAMFGLLGASAAFLSQPRVDATRIPRDLDGVLLFAPDGDQLRYAATGYEEAIADLLWVRAVLMFGEKYEVEADPGWLVWFRRTVEAVTVLDPAWRTAYFYGGTLLRVVGDIDGSDAIFLRGSENLPRDSFFPFSMAMNAYLYRDDVESAATWLDRASRLPGAPPWYPAAAAGIRKRSGDHATAIAYLEGILRTSDNPAIAADAQRQLERMRHDELVGSWATACRDHYATTGRRVPSPAAITTLGFELPANPRGDAWVVGNDGVVRSEGAEAERARKARGSEWAWVGR